MQIEEERYCEFKKRYSNLHPLIFHRSTEHAKNEMELFDILESFPDEFPVEWDEYDRRWKTQQDLIRFKELSKILG